ncbi:hypothetical protein CYMTET_18304 [Cymbomonas tetramitiformis]|uniref:Uncharacterized protein n=1 Tax=Cymbomonas tetramitiformis TaxID=36881 RepID=A0AAE0KW75_9CHLO|nr:hypothetical protein CYMTET_28161 [Cymbomonas tetramitiformis]KAK3273454.1 hypothetical protein CYMTET_18304 [Cymbomonas tetramitiformis]
MHNGAALSSTVGVGFRAKPAFERRRSLPVGKRCSHPSTASQTWESQVRLTRNTARRNGGTLRGDWLHSRLVVNSSSGDRTDGDDRKRTDTSDQEEQGNPETEEAGISSVDSLEGEEEGEDNKSTDELVKKLQELAERQRMGEKLNTLGQGYYERGQYTDAIVALEESLNYLEKNTELGGEAQLWLCLSYDAGGQRTEALDLYKLIETTHPIKNIRKQAEYLRYIMEAPKIKINADERVRVPNLDEVDQIRDRNARVLNKTRRKKKIELTMEERVLQEWSPKFYVPNKYVLFAASVVTVGLAWYVSLVLQQ